MWTFKLFCYRNDAESSGKRTSLAHPIQTTSLSGLLIQIRRCVTWAPLPLLIVYVLLKKIFNSTESLMHKNIWFRVFINCNIVSDQNSRPLQIEERVNLTLLIYDMSIKWQIQLNSEIQSFFKGMDFYCLQKLRTDIWAVNMDKSLLILQTMLLRLLQRRLCKKWLKQLVIWLEIIL